MSPPAVSTLHSAEETCRAAVAHQCAGGGSTREESSICTTKHNKIILDKKESLESEKQILVDPISLRESANMHPMMYPVTTGPKLEVMSVPLHHLLPPAAKGSKSMSMSMSSTSSSPRFDLTFTKHKKKYKNHRGAVSPLARQHSVALGNLERLRESHLRRSKSCGEGRARQPSVDFDLWSSIINKADNLQMDNETEVKVDKREEGKTTFHKKGGEYEDKFKCGACLFLPGLGLGLGKGKTVRARKELEDERGMAHMDSVSQRVSLEKFECGSWRSSAIINYEEDGDTTSNLFFDLPVELIRCSSLNDTESPVTTGFVFDNKDHHRKGVLKSTTTSSGSGQPRKSHESCNSSRHVRFSTSSPTLSPASPTSSCITPRLRKARDDFNAFLEAQSA